MRKMSRLRIYMSAGCAAFVAVLVFMTGCKALGDTGTEDEKNKYLPAAIPLDSLTVEDEEGFDYIRGFQPDRLDYEIVFNRESIGTPVVVKATAADQATVLVRIGLTITGQDQLSTKFPETSVRVDIKVTEKTGRVSTNYQVLLILDEAQFSTNLIGSVTINGNFDKDGLQAALSSNCNVLPHNATFTWYRNDVKVPDVEGNEYMITDSDNSSVIKVEVTAEGKVGKLAATRRAPRWESAEVVKELIIQAEELLAKSIANTVVGDPVENPHEYASIIDSIAALNNLMDGVEQTRETTGSDGVVTKEVVKVYDYSQIADKTDELRTLLQSGLTAIAEIITPKLVFNYTGTEQIVKLMNQKDALYEIELIGASGGHVATNGTPPAFDPGGKGGQVVARYNLPAGSEYRIRVGGEGGSTAQYDSATQVWNRPEFKTAAYLAARPGGWPNGGNGGKAVFSSFDMPGGSGGGGATDIRLETATGSFNGTSTDPRFVVAAGGGGAAQFALRKNGKNVPAKGGDAGKSGMAAQEQSELAENLKPQPGASSDDKGLKGVDGVNEGANAEGRGGGGGGYKGGGAITTRDYNGKSKVTGSGAGGSNFVKQDSSYINNSSTIGITNAFGNGSARIEWVGYSTK